MNISGFSSDTAISCYQSLWKSFESDVSESRLLAERVKFAPQATVSAEVCFD